VPVNTTVGREETNVFYRAPLLRVGPQATACLVEMTEAGYVIVELDELKLSFGAEGAPVAEEDGLLPVRVDLEILNHGGVFKWSSTSDSKVSSSVYKAVRQPDPEVAQPVVEVAAQEGQGEGDGEGDAAAAAATAPPAQPAVYILGFTDFRLKTDFIDLNVDVVSALANALLSVKIVALGGGGEVVTELCLPLFAVLTAPGACVSAQSPLCELSTPAALSVTPPTGSSLIGDDSYLSWRILCDNDLTEYCVGSSMLQVESVSLDVPPAAWGLHYADVVDPKAKVPPSAEQLRAAWLENIPKLIETQAKVASFTLTVGGPLPAPAAEVGGEGGGEAGGEEPSSAPPALLPALVVQGGVVGFDAAAAAAVPLSEDIRAQANLWSVRWGESPKLFLTRQQRRTLARALSSSSSSASSIEAVSVPVTITKTPTAEGAAAEGDVLNACGLIDLSPLAAPGVLSSSLSSELAGAGFVSPAEAEAARAAVVAEAEAAGAEPAPAAPSTRFGVTLSLSAPLVSAPAAASRVEAPVSSLLPPTPSLPQGQGQAQGQGQGQGLDAMAELRKEIAAAVKAIAQEYVFQFPSGLSSSAPASSKGASASASASAAGDDVTMADRKADFLHYLSTNGAYHSFKEALKPKVQLAARHLYGARAQALGRSAVLQQSATQTQSQTQAQAQVTEAEAGKEALDKVLAELYVTLVKESNSVMSALFSSTVVARDALLLDAAPGARRGVDLNPQEQGGGLDGESKSECVVDDESETLMQKHGRLLALALDAEADSRFSEAEKWHLERLLLCESSPRLASTPAVVHAGFEQISKFFLRRSASLLALGSDEAASDAATKARETLSKAVAADSSQWGSSLLLAAVLFEKGQEDAAMSTFKAILSQLAPSASISSLSEFDGYDSDSLLGPGAAGASVDPVFYAVLASAFHSTGKAVRARKALRLASRCFSLGGYKPDVSTHGSPKRTVVLVLAQAALLLADAGCVQLASAAASLATDCDAAASAKANFKGLPAATPPFVRVLLRRARSRVATLGGPAGAAASWSEAEGAALVAVDPPDVVAANVAAALSAAHPSSGQPPSVALDAVLRALDTATNHDLTASIPVSAYLLACRLLASPAAARPVADWFSVAAAGCRVHNSASLFLQLGASCLRAERLEDCEDALAEANLLDNRNAGVWAHLALLCLAYGSYPVLLSSLLLRPSLLPLLLTHFSLSSVHFSP